MKNFFIYCLVIIFALFDVSCDLDYVNRTGINPDQVWTQKNTINAFLNDIHQSSIPSWPFDGNDSDEAMIWNANMPEYLQGIVNKNQTTISFNYTTIEKINFFLHQLSTITEGVLKDTERKQMEGQAQFWRAWWYWSHVSLLGGVPLITVPQDIGYKESLFISRNSTSECITQILSDLDDAINKLPDTWSDNDYGRIDKCTAMAFKGRVLLHYACPLFNSTNDQVRWKNAYDANKEAVDFLRSQGKDLYPKFNDIWDDERNSEVIMVNQFAYPDRTINQTRIRPYPFSSGGYENNTPVLSLLLAFPKKDGSMLKLDREKLKNDVLYNKNFTDEFYTDRDDRFYTTVFYGGTLYPGGNNLPPNVRFWSTWRKVNGEYRSMYLDQGGTQYVGKTGFYCIKGLDKSLDIPVAANGETDWIPIRFAEVLMNFGECANQIGKSDEALQVLYDIRKRAGILSGTNGRYGITASTKEEIQDAYINESFAEFAFEGKRIETLRRWKRYDIINAQRYREAIYCVLNEDENVNTFDWTNDIMSENVRKKFHLEVIDNIYGGTTYPYNLSLNHWFYAISKTDLDRNSKLVQNVEWEGTFDPLK